MESYTGWTRACETAVPQAATLDRAADGAAQPRSQLYLQSSALPIGRAWRVEGWNLQL